MALSVKCQIGHDLSVVISSPVLESTLSGVSWRFFLSLPLPFALVLSLSLSKIINLFKKLKKKQKTSKEAIKLHISQAVKFIKLHL